MSTGKTYSTKYLLDNNNNRGSEGQVLISTSEGVNWSDGSDIIGGPYLPLSAGSSYPLTDTLFGTNTSMSGNGTYAGSMNLGNGGGTGEKHLTIGNGSTGNGYRYIDLVGDTTYTDYGFRIIRGNGGANTTSQIVHRGTGDFSIQTNEAGNLKFVTSSLERMRITSGGNVGIGTTSPSAKLQIDKANANSSVIISRSGTNIGASTSVGSITFPSHYNSSYTDYASIQAYSNALSAVRGSLDFKVKSTSGALLTGMTVYGTSSGVNVGIGTTSPSEKLVVDGKIRSLGDTSSADFYSTGNDALIVNNGTQNLKFWNNGSERMRIKGDGNVGIGTTSPDWKLHLNSSAELTPTYQKFTNGTATTGTTLGIDSDGDFIINNGEAKEIKLYTSDSQRVTIQSGGNVGIGNTGPVNGKLVVTSGVDGPLNTIRIQHTRDDSDVGTRALEIDMNLSGADTTTGDRTNRGIYVDLDSSADGDASHEHRIHGIESDVRFTGFSDIVRAGQFYAESGNITEKTAQLVGVYGQAIHDANSTNGGVSNMMGVYGYSQPQDLGDVDNAFGGYFLVNIGTNRGNADIGVTKGVEGEISIDKSSTINYGTMIGMSSVIDNNEGAVPNFGNQYLFKGDYQGTKGSNAWGIYTEGDKHYFEGKVGMGTTAPSHVLSVQDSVNNADVGISINNSFDDNLATSNPNAVVFINAASNNGYLRVHGAPANTASKHQVDLGSTAASSFLTFSPSGAERMRIDSSGNVGIGTTSPLRKLHVVGNFAVNAGTGEYYGVNITGGEGADPNILIGDWHNSSANIKWDSLGHYLRIDAQHGTSGAPIVFSGNDSAIEYMRIDSSGNVGIGTTSPLTKLQIDNQGQGEFSGANSSAAGKSHIILKDEGSTSRTLMSGPSIVFQTPANADGTNVWASSRLLGSPAAAGSARGTFSIQVRDNYDPFNDGTSWNWRTALTAINSGNVGIGTNSPSQKLHVAGRLLVNNGSLGAAAGSTIYHAEIAGARHRLDFKEVRTAAVTSTDWKNTTYKLQMRVDSTNHQSIDFVSDASYNEHIDIYTGNQVFNTRFNANGNVGIGTTSPSSLLHLESESSPTLQIKDTTNDVTFLAYAQNSNTHLANTSNHDLFIDTNNISRIAVKANGNVGIGTTSPGAKLEVNGNVAINSTGLTEGFQWFNDTNEIFSLEDTAGAGELLLLSSNSVKVKLNANGSSYLNGGNVGIGTTSPSEKLSVAGNAVLGEGMNRSVRYDSGGGNFRITPNNGGWATGYFFNNQSEGFLGGFGALGGSNDSFSYFWIGDDYNDTTMVIKPNAGNVGIGTTTPLAKLAVIGDVHVGDIYTPSDKSLKLRTQGGLFEITTYNTATAGTAIEYSWGTGGQGPLTINNAVGEVMRLDGGGNVGIGTASPVAPLHIAKATTTATDPLLKLERISPVVDYQDLNSSGYFYLKENFKNSSSTVIGSREVWQNPGGSGLYYNFDNGGAGGSQHRQKQNSFHWTINSNSEKLTLGTNGYLGVNDTSPDYQLDVNGSGRFTSTVTATNFILSSDERLKENVEKVCDNRVKADWKTFELKADKGQRRYGVIAQELEKTNPEFVREDVDGFKSVAYIDLLIAKIAELEARLEKLEK